MQLDPFPTRRPIRKKGRPRLETDARRRARMTDVARSRIVQGNTVVQVANRFRISYRTVLLWTARALTFPENESLRRFMS